MTKETDAVVTLTTLIGVEVDGVAAEAEEAVSPGATLDTTIVRTTAGIVHAAEVPVVFNPETVTTTRKMTGMRLTDGVDRDRLAMIDGEAGDPI